MEEEEKGIRIEGAKVINLRCRELRTFGNTTLRTDRLYLSWFPTDSTLIITRRKNGGIGGMNAVQK